MIRNFKVNRLGTVDFDGQFSGMRKPQSFSVYPIHAGNDASSIKVQSDTRIGRIDLVSGHVTLSKPRASGAYNIHLIGAGFVGRLEPGDLLMLKGHIMSTAHGKAGNNGVMYTDNSGALEVFGAAA